MVQFPHFFLAGGFLGTVGYGCEVGGVGLVDDLAAGGVVERGRMDGVEKGDEFSVGKCQRVLEGLVDEWSVVVGDADGELGGEGAIFVEADVVDGEVAEWSFRCVDGHF